MREFCVKLFIFIAKLCFWLALMPVMVVFSAIYGASMCIVDTLKELWEAIFRCYYEMRRR